MNFSELVADANAMCEGKGTNLGQSMLDRMARRELQALCRKKRWQWRRQSFTFSTSNGTATYDLSSVTTSPASKGKDAEEIIAVYYVKSATEVWKLGLAPYDDSYVVAAADTTDTGEPTSYIIERGAAQTLRLSPIPNGTYTIRVVCWAIPYFPLDDSSDTIPYLPVNDHHVLVSRLAWKIASLTYGQADRYKTEALKAQHDEDLFEMMGKSRIAIEDTPTAYNEFDAVTST